MLNKLRKKKRKEESFKLRYLMRKKHLKRNLKLLNPTSKLFHADKGETSED